MPKKGNYSIGYGRPPEATRFKKGRSGNSKGPPKKETLSIADLIDEMFDRKVRVVLEGKPHWVTMMELCLKRQVHALAKGDVKALPALMRLKTHMRKMGKDPSFIVKMAPDD